MEKFKMELKKPVTFWSLTIVLATVVLPMVGAWFSLSTLTKVIVVYFLVNGTVALAFGAKAKQMSWKLPVLLAQPLIFALLSTAIFGLVNDTYGYYLAPLYLILSLFTYFNAVEVDPAEEEFPVDGGYQDV